MKRNEQRLTEADGAIICQSLELSGGLEPTAPEERLKQPKAMADYLNGFIDQIATGYQVILRETEKNGGEKNRDRFVIHDAMLKALKSKGGILASIEKEGTLQGALRFSGGVMGEMYDIALSLATQKNYDDAVNVFQYLVYLNPYIPQLWQELGHCWQDQLKHDDALYAYCVAINCDPCNPDQYRRAVNLCLETKRVDTAKDILQNGVDLLQVAQKVEHKEERLARLNNMLAYVSSQH